MRRVAAKLVARQVDPLEGVGREGRGNGAREVVVAEIKVGGGRPGQRLGDGTSEPVVVDGEVAEGERREGRGNGAGELVEGEVEVIKAGETCEEVRDGAGEAVPVEAQEGEVGNSADGRGNGAGEAGVLVESEGGEEGEVGDSGRDGEGGVGAIDVEGGDPAGGLVATDAGPVAAGILGGPCDEDVGVAESLLDGEQGLLVILVAFARGDRLGGKEEH